MSKYDSVRAHIDFVRQSMREVSDDSNFTDEQIYATLLEIRAMILSRRLKKGKELPDSIYQTICVSLCEATYAECQDCLNIPADCYVLKTAIDIPKALYTGTNAAIRVSTLTGREIAPYTEELHKLRKYRKTGANNYYYVRLKNKLAIFNVPQNLLRGLKVTALFEDPAQASIATECPTDCNDVFNVSLGVNLEDSYFIHREAIKFLLNVDKMPEDRSNNADSTTPRQQI
jgi:hypothetical protein